MVLSQQGGKIWEAKTRPRSSPSSGRNLLFRRGVLNITSCVLAFAHLQRRRQKKPRSLSFNLKITQGLCFVMVLRGRNPGIVLVTRLWVTRAGGLPAPISPSYQQAGTNMKRRRDRFRYFLLLLFLTRAIKMEIRHGVVIPFDLWTRPLCQPLASGHCFRLGPSTAYSGCVHYSLICTSARSCQQTDWQ